GAFETRSCSESCPCQIPGKAPLSVSVVCVRACARGSPPAQLKPEFISFGLADLFRNLVWSQSPTTQGGLFKLHVLMKNFR
ncbi:unnamed protein product, partial [Gulo gulo]